MFGRSDSSSSYLVVVNMGNMVATLKLSSSHGVKVLDEAVGVVSGRCNIGGSRYGCIDGSV